MIANLKRRVALLALGGLFCLSSETIAVAVFVTNTLPNGIPSPTQYFGFEPGADNRLIDYHQLSGYFRLLANRSDRLLLRELGETTAGNDFLVAIISSPDNLARLGELQRLRQKLADPRLVRTGELEALITAGRTVVLVNCSLHADEVGATQMSPKLAYLLATSDSLIIREILANVILLLVPSQNPDGQLLVAEWYRRNLGTPYESAPLPWLYHRYAGHDLNRDWFMLTQQETRLVVDSLFNAWHPHITVDMHQMGKNQPRFFVPPYLDPIEPNVDPIIIAMLDTLGSHVLRTMASSGLHGVVSRMKFDAWTPARAYPHYHGGVRFLTEAASAEFATPVYLEKEQLAFHPESVLQTDEKLAPLWQGGRWSLQDIVDYDQAAVMAVLQHAAKHRPFWLRQMFEVQSRALCRSTSPAAYVVPFHQPNLQGLRDLLWLLEKGEVELFNASTAFTCGNFRVAPGDIVIPLAQPYGSYAKALLEKQDYPYVRKDGRVQPAYDITAHTLPLFLGVEAVAINRLPEVRLDRFSVRQFPCVVNGEGNGDLLVLDRRNTAAFGAVNELLRQGFPVWVARSSFEVENSAMPPGTFIVETHGLKQAVTESWIGKDDITVTNASLPLRLGWLHRLPQVKLDRLQTPHIGIYRGWSASVAEGWLRWVLEQYRFDNQSLSNNDVQSQDLINSLDVIILPGQDERQLVDGHHTSYMPPEYAGGLGASGLARLRDFVASGGTLLAFTSSCQLAIETFDLPVRIAAPERADFSAAGSVLRLQTHNGHPLTYGSGADAAIMFFDNAIFDCGKENAVATFAADDLLLSGYLRGGSFVAGKSAVAEFAFGRGCVILFGFQPHFRGQFRATYKFLFNALWHAPARATTVSD